MSSSQLKTITLKRGKEESLLRFHPWVFSGAIASLPDGLEEGETVRVEASDGRCLGTGHYEIGSIAVRMLENTDSAIDGNFYASRLRHAWDLRRRLGLIRPTTQPSAWSTAKVTSCPDAL